MFLFLLGGLFLAVNQLEILKECQQYRGFPKHMSDGVMKSHHSEVKTEYLRGYTIKILGTQ